MYLVKTYLSLPSKAQKFWAFLCLSIGVLFSAFLLLWVLLYKFTFLIALVLIGAPMAIMGNKWWFHKWLIYDQVWNWILGGDIKETVSSRLGKWFYFDHDPVFKGRFYFLNRLVSIWLDQVDKDHIKKSIQKEKGKIVNDFQMFLLKSSTKDIYATGDKDGSNKYK